jgi:predicted metal-dependent hydrolase
MICAAARFKDAPAQVLRMIVVHESAHLTLRAGAARRGP